MWKYWTLSHIEIAFLLFKIKENVLSGLRAPKTYFLLICPAAIPAIILLATVTGLPEDDSTTYQNDIILDKICYYVL